ncbi:transcriptional regulator [Algoriphagus sp. AGSA1]|uniref:winged helix-turn-helix domain-containing protein n=1 Tax=Algoriphagus sp. AGSA1 TaxID=2907213 RepID=UPI001F44E73E|nr:transcriptional regulator [Algoriphagus sp. AGSA1]MCE7057112.1 transcriptional regulator [Algoriphagus sp. AGSA1]
MTDNVKGTYDKAFENVVRLRVMSILMVNAEYDFNSFKEILEVTDGNLASHLRNLEKQEYISVNKSFVGRKPMTNYSATKAGKLAFQEHLKFLENLIQENKS